MNKMTQANKKGWDGLAAVHYKNYHVDKLIAGEPLLNDVIREEMGNVRGKSLVHLLCHIGTDTLSWALLGAKVTGIDISSESLKHARKLAKVGIEAEFIEADIMEVMGKMNKKYDIVFSSTGVLCWLPDIDVYARTVRHLLKENGFVYLLDGHPFRNVLSDDAGVARTNATHGDYFRKEVWQYDNLGDYTDPDVKIPTVYSIGQCNILPTNLIIGDVAHGSNGTTRIVRVTEVGGMASMEERPVA